MNYPARMRAFHWLSALLILGLLGLGFYMSNLPADAPDKHSFYPLHKALGVIAGVLVLARIAVRLSSTLPAPLPSLSRRERLLGETVHRLLYLGMLLMPLSGYLMGALSPRSNGLDLFGLVRIPDLFGKHPFLSQVFHELHELCAPLLLALVLLHIAAVLKHRFYDAPEKDVLSRML